MGLTDLIKVLTPSVLIEEPEDIFSSAPGFLFTDDLRNHHGDSQSTLIYKSSRFGDIELRTAEPESEEDRRLFAHYLWNAGIKLAELISDRDSVWSVEGERVLEFGAGLGLGGIVATLAGADEVVLSDYPAKAVLDNIERNAKHVIRSDLTRTRYTVKGHECGDTSSTFALEKPHAFTRILAADCYWMPNEHENLIKSMLHFLNPSPAARVLTVAGFHTGKAKLAAFYQEAVAQGLELEDIYEEDSEGTRRGWAEERDGGTEYVAERNKWLVIAILRRRTT